MLPVLLVLISLELAVRFIPNAFNRKAAFIKEHRLSVQLLILGSSHSQNIIPENFTCVTANLAYRGQDVPLDSALFFRYVANLPSLKAVLFELDYLSLEKVVPDDYFRLPWYHIYHNIDMGNHRFPGRYSLYLSEPHFFNNYLKYVISGSEKQPPVTSSGYTQNNFYGDFKTLHYDSSRIVSSAATRIKNTHGTLSVPNYRRNVDRINSIISYCRKNNIKFYLISLPVYPSYLHLQKKAKKARVRAYIDSLIATEAINGYWDFESDRDFTTEDFIDDDHLNSRGMQKLSIKLSALELCDR